MAHDWSSEELERFPFWSRAEIFRVSAIAGLAIVPMSVAALDAPKANRSQPASLERAGAPVVPTGRLRSVRVVTFDLGKLDPASLGDAESDPAR